MTGAGGHSVMTCEHAALLADENVTRRAEAAISRAPCSIVLDIEASDAGERLARAIPDLPNASTCWRDWNSRNTSSGNQPTPTGRHAAQSTSIVFKAQNYSLLSAHACDLVVLGGTGTMGTRCESEGAWSGHTFGCAVQAGNETNRAFVWVSRTCAPAGSNPPT